MHEKHNHISLTIVKNKKPVQMEGTEKPSVFQEFLKRDKKDDFKIRKCEF
jgi:hypothetical protein